MSLTNYLEVLRFLNYKMYKVVVILVANPELWISEEKNKSKFTSFQETGKTFYSQCFAYCKLIFFYLYHLYFILFFKTRDNNFNLSFYYFKWLVTIITLNLIILWLMPFLTNTVLINTYIEMIIMISDDLRVIVNIILNKYTELHNFLILIIYD